MSSHPPVALVVNNSVASLAVMRDLIEESGMQAFVLTRESVDNDGLAEFIEAHHPDVVVYDIPWPYEECVAQYEELRTDPRTASSRWVVITSSPRDVQHALRRDERLLAKPFEYADMLSLVVGRE
jgi:CheY-like chemotaxis protein